MIFVKDCDEILFSVIPKKIFQLIIFDKNKKSNNNNNIIIVIEKNALEIIIFI